jgi:PQQ-dependent dehydrogenase (methanol/ethanol family)
MAGLLVLGGCANTAPQAGAVTQERLLAADGDPDNWLGNGRTYEEQRYSPLTEINDTNAAGLGLAWAVDLDTRRGQESTPIVVDGIMYITTAWSKAMAIDAATGKVLWSFDPRVAGAKGADACCDVVNRGAAVWEGKVFFGTIDGRLIALDAKTGNKLWDVVTVDQSKPYTITGAPRVVKGKVIIGNSGAELGTRGYITAYDADTGKLVWRFYTIPGNPADGPDHAASDDAMAKIAQPTWSGKWWELGGGGPVWDTIVYDPDFNQILIGIGNGTPWNFRARSDGRGDNLFLASIVALDADTGAYKWHYQENFGETWDYDATAQITLADLTIDGKPRKVAMQAAKNAFFYVLDRSNGKLISAEAYTEQNWAERIDLATGRPIEKPNIRYADKPFVIYPSGIGAHAWMPMSYSPNTGLVYIPAMHVPLSMGDDSKFERHEGRWNTGVAFGSPTEGANAGKSGDPLASRRDGTLVAWDPVRQKPVWKVHYDWPWNGGTLATAGNLVFQGDARGNFHAYAADTGKELWRFNAERGIMAGPVSYRVNGEQYVAVIAGYGGSMGVATETDWMRRPLPNGVMLAFKIGGKAKLAPLPPFKPAPYVKSSDSFTADEVSDGQKWYLTYCSICHTGPVNPDLFRSPMATSKEAWQQVVIGGLLSNNGMISFKRWLTPDQAEHIRAYVLSEAKKNVAKEN